VMPQQPAFLCRGCRGAAECHGEGAQDQGAGDALIEAVGVAGDLTGELARPMGE
jgi:hypothetical protein